MFKKFLLVFFSIFLIIHQSFAAELTDFIPADAGVVVRMNVLKILSIPGLKAKIDEFISDPNNSYIKNIKIESFDPLKDIHSVAFFMPFQMPSSGEILNTPTAFVVEGKFDTKKIGEAMKKISGEIKKNRPDVKYSFLKEDGFPTISYVDEKGSRAKSFLFDNSVMVFGSESGAAAVKAVKMGKKTSVKTNKDFLAVLNGPGKDSNVSFIVKIDDATRKTISNNEKVEALKTIQFFSVDFTKVSGLSVSINGHFSDSADMDAIAKIVGLFLDSLAEVPPPFPAATEFLKNSKVVCKGKIATINSTISQASIDEFMQMVASPKGE